MPKGGDPIEDNSPLPIDIDALLKDVTAYRNELITLLEDNQHPETITPKERYTRCILAMEEARCLENDRPPLNARFFEDTDDFLRYLQYLQTHASELPPQPPVWRALVRRNAPRRHTLAYEVRLNDQGKFDVVMFEPATERLANFALAEDFEANKRNFPDAVHNIAAVAFKAQTAGFGCPSHGINSILKISRSDAVGDLFGELSSPEQMPPRLITDSYGNLLDYTFYVHGQSQGQIEGVLDNPKYEYLETHIINKQEETLRIKHNNSRVTQEVREIDGTVIGFRTFGNSIDKKRVKSLTRLIEYLEDLKRKHPEDAGEIFANQLAQVNISRPRGWDLELTTARSAVTDAKNWKTSSKNMSWNTSTDRVWEAEHPCWRLPSKQRAQAIVEMLEAMPSWKGCATIRIKLLKQITQQVQSLEPEQKDSALKSIPNLIRQLAPEVQEDQELDHLLTLHREWMRGVNVSEHVSNLQSLQETLTTLPFGDAAEINAISLPDGPETQESFYSSVRSVLRRPMPEPGPPIERINLDRKYPVPIFKRLQRKLDGLLARAGNQFSEADTAQGQRAKEDLQNLISQLTQRAQIALTPEEEATTFQTLNSMQKNFESLMQKNCRSLVRSELPHFKQGNSNQYVDLADAEDRRANLERMLTEIERDDEIPKETRLLEIEKYVSECRQRRTPNEQLRAGLTPLSASLTGILGRQDPAIGETNFNGTDSDNADWAKLTLAEVERRLNEYVKGANTDEHRAVARDRELAIWRAVFKARESDQPISGERWLDLNDLNLLELSPTLGLLPPSALSRLTLRRNNLTEWPPQLRSFTRLKHLDISYNPLASVSPDVARLPNLERLFLNNTRIKTLPPALGDLGRLEYLHLNHTPLAALPKEVGKLKKLTRLVMDHTKVEKLPSEINGLTDLTRLDIRSTLLTTLPSIPDLKKIESIWAENCQIDSLSLEDIATWRIGLEVHLEGNPIPKTTIRRVEDLPRRPGFYFLTQHDQVLAPSAGETPQDLLADRAAEEERLKQEISNLRQQVGDLTLANVERQLEEYVQAAGTGENREDAREKELTIWRAIFAARESGQPIPSELRLDLNGLNLDQLSPTLGLLPPDALTRLSVRGNNLTTWPPQLRTMTALKRLDISYNPLTTVSSEIGELLNLERLFINDTKVTTLPPEIGELGKLEFFHLNHTPLAALPKEIGNLKKLTRLVMNHTKVERLPPEINGLTDLERLDIRSTLLTTLPSIPDLKKIESIWAENCRINALSREDIATWRIGLEVYLEGNPIPPAAILSVEDLPQRSGLFFLTQHDQVLALATVDKLKEQLADRAREAERLRQETTNLRQEVDNTKSALQNAEKKNAALVKQHEEQTILATSQIQQLRQTADGLQEDNSILRARTTSLDGEVTRLRSDLEIERTEAQTLRSRLTDLEQEVTARNADLQEARDAYTLLDNQHADSLAQIDQLDRTVAGWQRDNADLTTQRTDLNAEVTRLRSDLETARRELGETSNRLQRDITNLEQEIAEIEDAAQQERRENYDLNQQITDLSALITQRQQLYDDTLGLLTTRTQERDQALAQITQLQARIQQLQPPIGGNITMSSKMKDRTPLQKVKRGSNKLLYKLASNRLVHKFGIRIRIQDVNRQYVLPQGSTPAHGAPAGAPPLPNVDPTPPEGHGIFQRLANFKNLDKLPFKWMPDIGRWHAEKNSCLGYIHGAPGRPAGSFIFHCADQNQIIRVPENRIDPGRRDELLRKFTNGNWAPGRDPHLSHNAFSCMPPNTQPLTTWDKIKEKFIKGRTY